jgi:hypothetical protein
MSYKFNNNERLKFGKQSELEQFPIISKFFNDNLKQTIGKYNPYDYEGDKYKYELKTRTNEYNKYPTTMIQKSKCDLNAVFIFKFTDGLYYIKYDEDKFKSYEVKKFTKYTKLIDYIYIPITDLIEITKNNK